MANECSTVAHNKIALSPICVWGYIWHEAVEWEPARRPSRWRCKTTQATGGCSCKGDTILKMFGATRLNKTATLSQAVDYASQICVQHLKVHPWPWAPGDSLRFAVSHAVVWILGLACTVVVCQCCGRTCRTPRICWSSQTNDSWTFRSWSAQNLRTGRGLRQQVPGASNSFTSADVHCQVKFLEYHEMGYGFTSIKRHDFMLTRRWAEKGIPSVAQVQCARLPGSRHLFMVLRVKEEAFGTSGSYSRTVG